MNKNLMSAERKPLDHFVSGALISGMTVAALSYNDVKKGKLTSQEAIKKTLKFSLVGGIATGAGIYISNSLVKKNYFTVASTSLLAVGSIIAIENFMKIQE